MDIKTKYQQQLFPVLNYIENNINEELSLEQLAKLANLSKYHFHRIFKAALGENIIKYQHRIKMQLIAESIFYNKKALQEIAFDFNYSTAQAMAKALKKHFGLTPLDFKQCRSFAELKQLMRHSSLNLTDSNIGYADLSPVDYNNDLIVPKLTEVVISQEYLAATTLAVISKRGSYWGDYQDYIQKLATWLKQQQIATQEWFFIYLDSPMLTQTTQCRAEIGVALVDKSPLDTKSHAPIYLSSIKAGWYAKIEVKILDTTQHDLFWRVWYYLYEQLLHSPLEIDTLRPSFEKYSSYDPVNHVANIGMFIPIVQ